MCIENLKCIALAVPKIIAIGVLVGVVNPIIYGKRRSWGSWIVPFETALVTFHRLSIVTFPLS